MTDNRFFDLLDVDAVKEMIAKCAKDEVCIILPHYSINVQMWYNEQDCDPEQCDWDWNDFEEAIGHSMQVNDFDDLIVDVHGIMDVCLFEDEFDGVDLFDDWEMLPADVTSVLLKHQSNDQDSYTYVECEALVKDLEKIGYTCDYGLDAIPFGLKKINN